MKKKNKNKNRSRNNSLVTEVVKAAKSTPLWYGERFGRTLEKAGLTDEEYKILVEECPHQVIEKHPRLKAKETVLMDIALQMGMLTGLAESIAELECRLDFELADTATQVIKELAMLTEAMDSEEAREIGESIGGYTF